MEPVNLQGAVITADAMSSQSEFVSFLVNVKQCNYILVLNPRYKKLSELIKTLFELDPYELKEESIETMAQWNSQTIPEQDKETGRPEIQSIKVLPASLLGREHLKNWAGLEEGVSLR